MLTGTITIANGAKAGTWAGTSVSGDFYTLPPVVPGDLFSTDGVYFYTIAACPNPTTVILETPYQGTTIAAPASCTLYRPKIKTIIVHPGEYSGMSLGYNGIAQNIRVAALPGARFKGKSAVTSGVNYCLTVGAQGTYEFHGVVVRTNCIMVTAVATATTAQATSIVRFFNCDMKTSEGRYYLPSSVFAKMTARDSIFMSSQDGFMPNCRDSTELTNCRLIGRNVYNGFFMWNTRVFSQTTPITANRCTFEIIHDVATEPSVASCLFDAAVAHNAVLNDCDIVLKSAGSADYIFVIANPGAATVSNANLVFNRCTVTGTVASGTKKICNSPETVYSGSGTAKFNHCNLNGYIAGGNGTFIPDISAGRFNVA